MMTALGHIMFWGGLLSLLHTYLFYPLLLKLLARGKAEQLPPTEEWPEVFIIMSAYNEERVIEEKMASLSAQEYPEGRLQILVGSDCSDDGTNRLAAAWAGREPRLSFFPYTQRRGKPEVINELAQEARRRASSPDYILIITDASVMMEPGTARRLAARFADPGVGLVDSHIKHTGMQRAGISEAENTYISGEVLLKHREGLAWGCMMGPFGGCYALRGRYFSPVPSTFLVDDFYITMRLFEQGGRAVSALDALCYEAVSHDIREEFRRKVRISAGNFQNLKAFRHLWWPPFGRLGFAFFSHKVLRWLGPFALIALLAGTALLALGGNLFYQLLFGLLAGGMLLLPPLDQLLHRWQIDWLPVRGARYFLAMNRALLAGFYKYLKGVRTNVWQPTKRN
ncbi:glycosyltransferase [Phaeodactylibacter luteus]|uniref:Glycosyltransferase n=1 Tax=Phaeodactylibacter luteus TaxID=1564516 RepID=A0A5C6RNJ0_9BACT|nr:glycosyltransferase [Phaeodactylibacter luteus]TXB63777.1 glycosyltransferase [Phaeodactylibacter luteus]